MTYSNKTIEPFKGELIRIEYFTLWNKVDVTAEIVDSNEDDITININNLDINKTVQYKNIISLKFLKDEQRELFTDK